MSLLSMAGVSIWGISVLGEVSFWGSLPRGSLSKGDISSGGSQSGGLCLESKSRGSLSREVRGLCLGVSVKEVSVQGVSVGRTPRIRNALFFLLQCNHFIAGSLR